MYDARGIDLRALPLVGVGSVCRRQAHTEAVRIVHSLTDLGIKLHGFGFKTLGLRTLGTTLVSADSMAWSYAARREPGPMFPECRHRKCANCMRYMLAWRERVLSGVGSTPHQMAMDF